VFNALSTGCRLAVIPQENSIFGSVIETYDQLRHPTVGTEKLIRGEITIGVQHSLVVRKGVKLQDVIRVLSHEQASRIELRFQCPDMSLTSGLGTMSWLSGEAYAKCLCRQNGVYFRGCTSSYFA
jgi:hypothetical protein